MQTVSQTRDGQSNSLCIFYILLLVGNNRVGNHVKLVGIDNDDAFVGWLVGWLLDVVKRQMQNAGREAPYLAQVRRSTAVNESKKTLWRVAGAELLISTTEDDSD